MPTVIETTDAAANTGTAYSILLGDDFLGSLDRENDRDWVRVTLEANYGYYALLQSDGGSSALTLGSVGFRNSAGSGVGVTETDVFLPSLGYIPASTAGTFFLDVRSEQTQIGAYSLALFREEAGNRNTRETLAAGETITSQLDYGEDSDWFRVTLENNYGYYAVLAGDGGPSSLTTASLTFRNAAGSNIASFEGGLGGTSFVQIDTTSGGTFYLDVGAGSFGNEGDYTLQLVREVARGIATRETLAVGQTFASTIDYREDSDWVRVTLEDNYGYYAVLSGVGAPTSLFGVTFRNSAGSALTGGSTSSVVALDSTSAGQFYLDVTSNSSEAPDYALQLFREVARGTGTRENLAVGDTFASSIDYAGDTDWVRMVLESNYGYYAVLTGDGGASQLSGLSLTLRNNAGSSLGSAIDNAGRALVSVGSAAAGTFYLDVAASSGFNTGGYDLQLFREVAGSRNTLESLGVDGQVAGRHDYADDSDWFAVNLSAGITYQLALIAEAGSPAAGNMSLFVRNSAGSVVSDSSGSTGVIEFTFLVATGGTYYLDVRGSGGETDYTLAIGDGRVIGTSGPDQLLGTRFDELVQGLDSNDRLDGGLGDDTMEGGLGNDIYFVNSTGDVVQGEAAFGSGGGIDTVFASVNFVAPTNVELVRAQAGAGGISLTGNDAPGTLVGNEGANRLDGRGGNDQINGNAGNDTIIGGEGADTLVGGTGADTFVFSSVSNSRAGAAARDVINGFTRAPGDQDVIDLSAIDASTLTAGVNDAFSFIGAAAFALGGASAGQLRLVGLGGPNALILEGDVNGDRVADFQVFVNGQTTMLAGDFIL